jgi:hypothetical protein
LTERLPKAGEAYRVPFAKISCSAGASSDCLWQGAQIDPANIEPLAADHVARCSSGPQENHNLGVKTLLNERS